MEKVKKNLSYTYISLLFRKSLRIFGVNVA
jgi:hypothetical protein